MRSAQLLVLPALLCLGCLAGPRGAGLQPLEREGELYVQLEPLPAEAARLSFVLEAAAALRADGAELPLSLSAPEVPAPGPAGERQLAWGRLEPGAYVGLSLKVRKAGLAGEAGPIDLLPPEAPVRVEAPFQLHPRRAVVLRLALRWASALDQGFAFTPAFEVEEGRRALAQLAGYAANAESHSVTVFDKRAHRLTAVLPTGREPWGLALDPAQGRLYVALNGEDAVQVWDAVAGEEVGRIPLRPGDEPRELAFTPDRRTLLVADSGSNTVSFVDPQSMLEVARVPVGEAPTSILLDRAGARAYVFNERSSFVSVLDVANRAAAGTIATDYGPLRGQLNRAGTRLYVVSRGSPDLVAYNLPGLSQAARVYVGLGTQAIKVDPNTDLLYVAQGGAGRLAVFNGFSLLPIDFVEVPGDASQLVIDDAEGTLFALLPERRSLAVIGLVGRKVLAELDLGPGPRQLVLAGERN